MKQTMESLCKTNGATSHYVVASFVFSTPSDLSFIAGKADSYVKNEALVQVITWQIQQIT